MREDIVNIQNRCHCAPCRRSGEIGHDEGPFDAVGERQFDGERQYREFALLLRNLWN